jgi:hypothetical protein
VGSKPIAEEVWRGCEFGAIQARGFRVGKSCFEVSGDVSRAGLGTGVSRIPGKDGLVRWWRRSVCGQVLEWRLVRLGFQCVLGGEVIGDRIAALLWVWCVNYFD